jgi:hypothetical protein
MFFVFVKPYILLVLYYAIVYPEGSSSSPKILPHTALTFNPFHSCLIYPQALVQQKSVGSPMAASMASSSIYSTPSTVDNDGIPLKRAEGLVLILETPKGTPPFSLYVCAFRDWVFPLTLFFGEI